MEKGGEIDLWELLARGLSLFRRKKAVILSLFAAGLATGAARYYLAPSEYAPYCRSEYAVRSSVATDELMCDVLNNIPSVVKQGQQLHPGFASLRNIRGRVSPVTGGKSRLKVAVEVFDARQLGVAVEAVTDYVHSFDRFRQDHERFTAQHRELLDAVEKQLSQCNDRSEGSDSARCAGLLAARQEISNELDDYTVIEFLPLRPGCFTRSNARAAWLNLFAYGLLGLVTGFVMAAVLSARKKQRP